MKKFKVEIIFLMITILAAFAANIGSVKGFNNNSFPSGIYPYPYPPSNAKQDGHILESSETSGIGGSINSLSSKIYIGDNVANQQYRGILSFNTSPLPDDANITSVVLKFKYAGKSGTLPFGTHGNLIVDIRKGSFSNNTSLQLNDFKASPSKLRILSMTDSRVGYWYSQPLSPVDFQYISLNNVTQFRLRFARDDNNDFGTDLLKIYSGGTGVMNEPKLIIEYSSP